MIERTKNTVIGYLCAAGAVIFWGFDTVIIRWLIHQGVNPFLIGDLRLFIGSATLATIISTTGIFVKTFGNMRIRYSKFFWIITASLATNFLLFHKGLAYTTATDAILLEAFAPVMVLVLIILLIPKRVEHLIKHERLPQLVLRIVVIGSIGSSILFINDPKDLLTEFNSKVFGDLIEFAAMFAWALVLLGMHEYQHREKDQNTLAVTSQFLFFAALLVAPFVPWKELILLSQTQMIWISVLGVFSTGFSYLLWHIASKYLDILPLMTIFNFVSIFTILTESMFLGLNISWTLILGTILILYAAMKAKLINSQYRVMEEKEQMEPHNP